MSVGQQQWEQWFQEVWAQREDVIYRQIFGELGPTVFTLTPQLFQKLGVNEIDERWLVHGVLESSPQPGRDTWAYVTTALSNPWGVSPDSARKDGPSGIGFELMMETREKAPWAIQVLQWLMAVNILAASGILKGDTVYAGACVPLNVCVDPSVENGSVRNLAIYPAAHRMARFNLDSGFVDLLICIGITDKEKAWLEAGTADELATKLIQAGYIPATVADRPSVV
jgi:hypothetical protein